MDIQFLMKQAKKLEKAMNAKLTVDAKVNPEILGGVIIRERMRQMDASVITFLKNLKYDLKSKKLKVKAAKPAQPKAEAKKPAAKSFLSALPVFMVPTEKLSWKVTIWKTA